MFQADRQKAINMWHRRTWYSTLCALALLGLYAILCAMSWMVLGPVLSVVLWTFFLIVPSLYLQSFLEGKPDADTLSEEPAGEVRERLYQIRARIEQRTRTTIPPILISRLKEENAFIVHAPSRGDALILLTRSMLRRYKDPVLRAAVAHELGHFYAWDYHLHLVATQPAWFLFRLCSFPRKFGKVGSALTFAFMFPLRPLEALLAFTSRQREFAADSFMLWVVGEVDSLEELLFTKAEEVDPENSHESLYSPGMLLAGHPTNVERIDALRALEVRSSTKRH
ncbi:M48 family metalloprotease [Candidatus Uhrbacteria bacterium]|nr:M48 family metalloprotease [Candidatus Uhrbacteria bacterium]